MRRSHAALVVLALLPLLARTPASAHTADGPTLVTTSDPAGDVKLLPHGRDLKRQTLRSIDVQQVTLDMVGRDLRITAELQRFTPDARRHRYNQMVLVNFVPADGNADWRLDVGMSPQLRNLGYAYLALDGSGSDYRSCDPLRTHRGRGAVVTITVPGECLPPGPAEVEGASIVGLFRSDAYQCSRDRFRFPEPVDLWG